MISSEEARTEPTGSTLSPEVLALAEHLDTSEGEIWPNKFSLLADELRSDFPRDFAAAEVNPDQASGWIAFRDSMPAEAGKRIAELGGIEVRKGLGTNETEIGDAVTQVFSALEQTWDSAGGFTTYPDPSKKLIVVEFGSAVSDESDVASLLETVDRITTTVDLPNGFEISVVDTRVSPSPAAELFDGGRDLDGCTGAFPVKRKLGTELGIFTAGHCPGTGSYDGTANAFFSPYIYSIYTGPGSGGGDFRWNHSKYLLSGTTNIGSSRRTFTSHATASVGASICGYGKSTGYKCQTVEACGLSSSSTVPDNGATYSVGGLCRTVDQVTAGGDSGGPWFFGNTAYGIHHGSNSLGSYFSLVNNALNQTRVNMVVDSAGNTIP